MEELKQEGHKFRFEFITGVAHDEVIELYSKADIVIDQLRIGWYGVASVEAMALGKCTVAYIREDIEHHLTPFNKPIVNANPETIKEVIKELIYDRNKVVEKGRTGRKFVEDYHCMNKVATKYKNIYDEAYNSPKLVDAVASNNILLSMLEQELLKSAQLHSSRKTTGILETKITALKKRSNKLQISVNNLEVEKKKLKDSNIALSKKIRSLKTNTTVPFTKIIEKPSSSIDKVLYFLNDGTDNKQIFDKPIRKAPFRVLKKLGLRK